MIGWLAALAPEAAGCRVAGPLATAAVRGRFRVPRALDDALASQLRRAAATAVLHVPERLDPVAAQRAILADRKRFLAALERDDPAIVVLAELFDGLEPTRSAAVYLAPATLETFRVQAHDLFPREDMGGLALAIGVVEAVIGAVEEPRRGALARELARLRARSGTSAGTGEASPTDGAGWLRVADRCGGHGDTTGASEALSTARTLFEASADTLGVSAVLRRQAGLLPPAERVAPLLAAARYAEEGGDRAAVTEALEDLAQAYAELGQVADAMRTFGGIARRARGAVDAAGEARALQLAGRLLCEAPAGHDDPGHGLVMLLFAADLAASVDPVVADLIRRYITGFQYTLTDARFAEVEPLLDLDRASVVAGYFAGLGADGGIPV